MSARETARKIERLFAASLTSEQGMVLSDVVKQAIGEAVAEERANCEQIARAWGATDVAKAIRARRAS